MSVTARNRLVLEVLGNSPERSEIMKRRFSCATWSTTWTSSSFAVECRPCVSPSPSSRTSVCPSLKFLYESLTHSVITVQKTQSTMNLRGAVSFYLQKIKRTADLSAQGNGDLFAVFVCACFFFFLSFFDSAREILREFAPSFKIAPIAESESAMVFLALQTDIIILQS